MKYTFMLALLILQGCAWANEQQRPICTREQAIKAEEEAGNLNTVEAIYSSFQRFYHCDDGAIAQGYSESIVRLLVHNWSQIAALNMVTSSDNKFERFILRHIDETMAVDDQQMLLSNTRNRCPPDARRLCRLIEKAATPPANVSSR